MNIRAYLLIKYIDLHYSTIYFVSCIKKKNYLQCIMRIAVIRLNLVMLPKQTYITVATGPYPQVSLVQTNTKLCIFLYGGGVICGTLFYKKQ